MNWATLGEIAKGLISLARESLAANQARLRRQLEASEAARKAAEREAADERRRADILTHYSTIDRRGT
jgi:outer membrane murein-binding lipoprotein Lpp